MIARHRVPAFPTSLVYMEELGCFFRLGRMVIPTKAEVSYFVGGTMSRRRP
jgi:hypothetical protein